MDQSFSWHRVVGAGDAPWRAEWVKDHRQFFEIQRNEPDDKRIVVSDTNFTHLVRGGPWETYYPLQSPISLHRNFAALPSQITDRSTEELFQFIYWFGFLEIENPGPGIGERLSFWFYELREMQTVVSAFDARFEIAETLSHPPDCERTLINQKLIDHCKATLTPDDAVTVAPTNLLGVMWLEYASAVHRLAEGRRPAFRQCAVCARHFEQARRDQKFCTQNCKMKEYRTRTGR